MDSDSGTYVNGGTVVALGSTMDWARADDSDAAGQAVMNLQFTSSQSADEAIIVTDLNGNIMFAYDPDKDELAGSNARWYRGAIISSPGLQTGESYYVYVGGDVTGSETKGVYDISTVTGFTSEAIQQCYTGTGNLGGFGGMGRGPGEEGSMGGFRPDMDFGDMPSPGDPGEGFDRPGGDVQMRPDRWGDEDFEPDSDMIPPDMPDGGMPQGGFGDRSQGSGGTASVSGNITFTMTARVNSFSGVTDYIGGTSNNDSSGKFTDVELSVAVIKCKKMAGKKCNNMAERRKKDRLLTGRKKALKRSLEMKEQDGWKSETTDKRG